MPIERKGYEMMLDVKLEGGAFASVTHSMLVAMRERDQLRASRKDILAEWRDTLAQKEEEIEAFRHELDHGMKELVKVEACRDLARNWLTVTRMDTGEIVEDRALTAEEQQLDLAGLDAPPPDATPEESGTPADGTKAEPDRRNLPEKKLPIEE